MELARPVAGADRHVDDCGPDGEIGDQYRGAIVTFDPENTDVSPFVYSFQEWAAAVLADNGVW